MRPSGWGGSKCPSGNAVVDAFRSLWHYHGGMLSSARTITSDHPSDPIGWLVVLRPPGVHALRRRGPRCWRWATRPSGGLAWRPSPPACGGGAPSRRAGAALLGVAALLPWALSVEHRSW